jgi:hypothetical protein
MKKRLLYLLIVASLLLAMLPATVLAGAVRPGRARWRPVVDPQPGAYRSPPI